MKNKKLAKSLSMLFVFLMILNTGNGVSAQQFSGDWKVATFTHKIEDGLVLETKYKISPDFGEWLITSNKAIDMEITVKENSLDSIVLVEHMHADIFLESTKSNFDDTLQDSMDDKYHGIQGGFLINEKYGYYETFSIEGKSSVFVNQFYVHFFGYYGSAKMYKLSEQSLRDKYDIYGQTIYVVYDIIVRKPSEQYFHKVIISDNIYITLDGEMKENFGNIFDITPEETPGFGIIVTILGLAIFITIFKKKRGV